MVAGRPRKKGVERYANGAITHKARQEDVMAAAISQRIKAGIKPDMAKSDLAGTVIGKLYLTGQIQRHHFDAAEHFALDCDRWLSISGLGRGTAQGSSLMITMMGKGGITCSSDPPPEVIDRAKNNIESAKSFLRVNLAPDEYFACMNALDRVLVRDETPAPGSIAILRSSLNILARHYRLAAP